MGDAFAFVIKGDTPAFVMRDGMKNAFTFVIKGDTPLETRTYFICIIRDTRLPFIREVNTSRILT
jgi:hypothetical protein